MCSWSLDDRFVITTQVRNANMDGIDPTDIPAIEAALQQRTKVWDANTGTLLRVLEGHTMDVIRVSVVGFVSLMMRVSRLRVFRSLLWMCTLGTLGWC
jgi:hypothetical protein